MATMLLQHATKSAQHENEVGMIAITASVDLPLCYDSSAESVESFFYERELL